MRDDLIRYVKKRFGPTYGSRELKELRSEIVGNALERYDEAVASGADSRQAYGAAVDSLGDIKAMLASMKIPEKQRVRGLAIAIPIFLLMTAAVIWAALSSGVTRDGLKFLFFGLIAVGLTAAGVITLVCGVRKNTLSIIMIVIGANMLPIIIYLTLLIGAGVSSSRNAHTYDYTKEIGNISSIEYVTIVGLDYENSRLYESGLDYTVLWSVDREQWPVLLERLADVEYVHPPNDPPTLYKNNEMFLIKYIYPRDGVTFVFIGRTCPGCGRRVDSRVLVEYKLEWSDYDKWESLMADYGRKTIKK